MDLIKYQTPPEFLARLFWHVKYAVDGETFTRGFRWRDDAIKFAKEVAAANGAPAQLIRNGIAEIL